ncbi:MAG: class I tRNA ligase family protein [Patescibacteria group bacterium]
MAYNHKKIESKWQKKWEEGKVWQAKDNNKRPKWYSLIEFPYPSGDGLHVGHIRSNTAMDIISRKRRMEGYNVLYPIGWDAFGLPTENYAIKTGVAPEKATAKNIKTFTNQLKALGFSFDWDREINTTDPQYYKWTQWIFLQFLKHGLAYKDSSYINWCLSCKTGLANEEVVGGKCERCGGDVEKRLRKQWMLRITSYADKLLEGLDKVDFLEEIKAQQRNWIGRSEGRLIQFSISKKDRHTSLAMTGGGVKVFTTRPDTIDGATFMVLAPENPLIGVILNEGKNLENKKEVEKYIKTVLGKSDIERQESKIKTGVELKGITAINPYNKEKIPIWVSDYVLMHYGTGAIMAVPQHDERDREFAEKFNLPIKNASLVPKSKWPGKEQINYKLRDWVFSRQRYWGEPIPVIICKECGFVPVPEKDLPVILPKIKDYQPRDDGQSPLASAAEWLKVKCPDCGDEAERETDTMPNWAGSSWYFLAYIVLPSLRGGHQGDRRGNLTKTLNAKPYTLLKYWLPVDWYNGGMEHTTLHLLYSRFWNQFLYDIGVVPVSEPYQKRTAHGLVLGEDGQKMSKSRGNIVTPDYLVKEFGADSLRLYEMFMGPFNEYVAWNPQGIVGMRRFLNKVYNVILSGAKDLKDSSTMSQNDELERLLHQTIKKVTEDIEEMKFNTAISALMIFVNKFEEESAKSVIPDIYYLILLKLLFPFAPHLAQELYTQRHSEAKTKNLLLDTEPWPVWDEELIQEEKFELVIQVNGKVRGTVTTKKGISKKEAEKLAIVQPTVKKWFKGIVIKKIIFVPDRLINFIV